MDWTSWTDRFRVTPRRAVVLAGLPGVGSSYLTEAMHDHRRALAAAGVHVLTHNTAEARAAAVEVTRTHRRHGLRRRDVEGTWARAARRVRRTDPLVLTGHGLLADAAPDQAALVRHALAGREIHLVIVTDLPHEPLPDHRTADRIDAVIRAWTRADRHGRIHMEHVHVLGLSTAGSEPLARLGEQFGRLLEVDLPDGARHVGPAVLLGPVSAAARPPHHPSAA